jgi:hypothetical protein
VSRVAVLLGAALIFPGSCACNGAGCGSYSTIQTTAVQASCPFPPCDPGFTAEDEQ